MPEKPEAQIIADRLEARLAGRIIVGILSLHGFDLPRWAEVQAKLPATVGQVFSRGKKVIFYLIASDGSPIYLVTSLGMTGKWLYFRTSSARFVMEFYPNETATRTVNGHEIREVCFDDQRRFGGIEVAFNPPGLQAILSTVGADWLLDDISPQYWLAVVGCGAYDRWAITKFLMEQSIFAGVGNYLKSEILYCAQVHPTRKIGSLSAEERLRIFTTARYIVRESYEARGFTIESFLSSDGEMGQYQARVYRRTSDQYGYVVKHEILPGSGPRQVTWWVDEIQK